MCFTHLDLGGTAISDDGLVYLRKLQRLWLLKLDGTAVTDSGLRYLGPLHNLESVFVRGTHITDAGITAFNRSYPRVHIHNGPVTGK
jgi:hypothetical protein